MARSLLKAVLAGDYARGLQRFAAIKRPCVEDLRWGGVCQLHLGNALEARRLLLMAVARGHHSARIELATCLRFEGEIAAARAQLSALDLGALSAQDAALSLREAAILEQHCGEVGRAAALLETAWSHAVGADPHVQSAVAQSIALVAAQRGHDVKATRYLQFAEEHANAMRRVYVQLSRAASATCLGWFTEAETALKAAELHLADCPLAGALLPYRWGVWCAAQGQSDQARAFLGRATALAREQQQPETECYALLALAALATAASDPLLERASLSRARTLVKTARAQAYLDWRQGAALVRQGDGRGTERLHAALAAFRASGCPRETIWALLHLSEAHLTFGAPLAARAALREAADAHLALGGQQHLDQELRGLVRTRALLDTLSEDDDERALCQPPKPAIVVADVALMTLKRPAVLVNGHGVQLQMKKSIEVLAFLLHHGDTLLETLQSEVFPGVPLGRSKNYIHQVRHQLKRLVPGLSVPYDAATRTYRLRCEAVRLTWDWQQLPDVLLDPTRDVLLETDYGVQDFLPDSDSEWVEIERERMRRWLVRIGVETIDALGVTGDYASCARLAQRLMALDPLDETLHVILIRATAQASGLSAAQTRCGESRALFAQEVGHVPQRLDALAQQLQYTQPN